MINDLHSDTVSNDYRSHLNVGTRAEPHIHYIRRMPHNCGSCNNTPSLQAKNHMHELESVHVAHQNYNAAKKRKRTSRTNKIQTRRTRDKQCKNKQQKNPLATTRIERYKGNKTTTCTTFLAQFENPTHQVRKGAL